MSQNCECNENLTPLPVKNLVLSVDASNLPNGCNCMPGEGSALDYSLEEQLTGKRWIDGKKIYQKTIKLDILGGGRKKFETGIKNLENIISITGTCEGRESANVFYRFPLPYTFHGYDIAVWMDEKDIYTENFGKSRTYMTTNYITLQYTKSETL